MLVVAALIQAPGPRAFAQESVSGSSRSASDNSSSEVSAPTNVKARIVGSSLLVEWDRHSHTEKFVVEVVSKARSFAVGAVGTSVTIASPPMGAFVVVVTARSPQGLGASSAPVSVFNGDSNGDTASGLIVRYVSKSGEVSASGEAVGAEYVTGTDVYVAGDIGFGLTALRFPQELSATAALEAAAQIRKSDRVMSAEPDYIVSIDSGVRMEGAVDDDVVSTSSVQLSPPWGLDRVDQRALPLNGRYEFGGSGSGVDVYVVDTGIRSSHTDFGGRVVGGYSSVSDGRGTEDCDGHGTHVAGTIGGATYGVAKAVNLIPVRVLDCAGSGSNSGVIAGLNWIVSHHTTRPAVVNMSLGGPASSLLDSAVNAVINDGVTVVVASGNDGTLSCNESPARVAAAITVNAATAADDDASWSNYGSCSDIYAPGVNILSADSASNSATAFLDGTSMASPHVAGVAARWLGLNSSWTPSQVWSRIRDDSTFVNFGLGLSGDPNRLLYMATSAASPTPTIASSSSIAAGVVSPSVVVSTSTVGYSFRSGVGASDVTVGAGSTGLTLASVTRTSSTQLTLGFSGTAAAGTLTVQVKASASDPAAAAASNTLSIAVSAASPTPVVTTSSRISRGVTAPSVIVDTSTRGYAFKVGVGASDLEIGAGSTGLTLASVTRTNGTRLTLRFSGTAAAGTLTVQVKASASDPAAAAASNTLSIAVPSPTPTIASSSSIAAGAVSPSVVVRTSTVGYSFRSEIGLSDLELNVGNTTLNPVAVTRDSANQLTIQFDGTTVTGTITVRARTSASDPASSAASNTLRITVQPPSPTPIITTTSRISRGAVAPSIEIRTSTSRYTFKAGVTTADLNISTGLTGLVVASLTRTSSTRLTVRFSGIASSGAISIQVLPSAALPAAIASSNTVTVVVP